MAMYTCEKCGMSVGTMTCGHCGKEVVAGAKFCASCGGKVE